MRYSWLIVISIVRLLSARYFARIFLSSFSQKIFRDTSLEVYIEVDIPWRWLQHFFEHIYLLFKFQQSMYHWKTFYTDSALQKNYTLKISIPWDISSWLGYVIMKILFNYERMLIAWYLRFVTKRQWFSRIWLIKALIRSKDQKRWS